MTDFIYRIAIIVPDADVDEARALAAEVGWGEGCYSVPLSTDGAEPATHWGLSTAGTQRTVDVLNGAEMEGVDPERLAAVVGSLEWASGSADTNARQQFDTLAGSLGVQQVQAEAGNAP